MPETRNFPDAIRTGFVTLAKYVVIPLAALNVVLATFPTLQQTRWGGLATLLVAVGLAVTAAATLEEYFTRGSLRRLLFALLALAASVLWFYILFGGATLIVPYAGATFTVDARGFLIFVGLAFGLRAVLAFAEYSAGRAALAAKPVTASEALAAAAPSQPGRATKFCSSCSAQVLAEDRVCTACGHWFPLKGGGR